MIDRNSNIRTQQTKQQDPIELFKKYRNLLWNKKLWILAITAIISILWFILSPILLPEPEYSASVVIKFDDPRLSRGINAVTDFTQADRTEGKIALLETNSVLAKVVDTLKLNLRIKTKDIKRYSFFKNIRNANSEDYGDYRILLDDEKILVFYSNDRENINEKLMYSNIFSKDSSNFEINFNKINLVISTSPLIDKKEIELSYINPRITIGKLKEKIQKDIDRSQTVLTISYSDKDPEVAAEVINTIAKIYIDKLLSFKKYRTTSVLKSLKEQLDVAQRELEISEEKLKTFREENPYLVLSRESSDIVTQLSAQESELSNLENNYEQLKYLVQKKDNSIDESKDLVYQEILSSIATTNLAGAQVWLEQYNALLAEKSRLISENYSTEHVLYKDIKSKLKKMQDEIDERTVKFVSNLENQIYNLKNNISSNKRNIRRLPRSELKLAELERDQLVKSNIYSSINVKYNEAKVSDASIISDAFIIEEAQVPIILPNLFEKLMKFLIGPILGFVISIVIIIGLNVLDKSVKEANEVEEKLSLPVLATIPVILDEKWIPDDINQPGDLDPKLITSNYAPSMANEKFRLIRTKLFMDNNKNRTFIISSLLPGDGKSLVAANTAITFAQQKNSTLLIDGDIRRGVLHNTFNCNKKPGLVDILARTSSITQTEISKIVQTTHIPNLFLISCGIQAPNPSELLGNPRMEQLYMALQKKFSVIIVDTPPIEVIPDALILNSLIHNMLVIVRYGKTNLNKLSDKISEYSNIKNDFKGIIINASPETEYEKYSSYSYYHY